MKMFFYLHFKEDDGGGIAYSSNENVNKASQVQSNTEPLKFRLTGFSVQDYQANDLGWPLMSSKLKNIIESLVEGENLWKLALIEDANSVIYEYFVPYFPRSLDVIDRERSKIVSGPIGEVIIKACLAAEKVRELDFFFLPDSKIRLIVSDRLKTEIENGKVNGVDFSIIPVV